MKQLMVLIAFFVTGQVVLGQGLPPGRVICRSTTEGLYTGSPSILVLSNGDYLASHDFFGPKAIENGGLGTTRIFVSKDKGKHWRLRTTIQGQFWSTLFQHKGSIYILGTRGGVNDCVIRRSNDMGQSWSEPKNSETGLLLPKNGNMGYHCAPMPVTIHAGRIWRAFEYTPDNEMAPRSASIPRLVSLTFLGDARNSASSTTVYQSATGPWPIMHPSQKKRKQSL